VSFGAEDLTWHISRGIFQAVKNKRGIENGRWRSTFFSSFSNSFRVLSSPKLKKCGRTAGRFKTKNQVRMCYLIKTVDKMDCGIFSFFCFILVNRDKRTAFLFLMCSSVVSLFFFELGALAIELGHSEISIWLCLVPKSLAKLSSSLLVNFRFFLSFLIFIFTTSPARRPPPNQITASPYLFRQNRIYL
jgi:hypothetical protein